MPIERNFVLPDLDLGQLTVRACVWLAHEGQAIVQGDRLLEVVAGDVTIDLPAPVSGTLLRQHVAEDEPLQPGQVLGVIAEES